jgi:hypothetical protein
MYHRLVNSFGRTRWVVWNVVLVRLETVLVSVQDRCTVYTEHTMGIEIVLDALDGTPR